MALNIRQQKFAKLVASGMSQTDARQAAYGDGWPPAKRVSHKEAASRMMKQPEIREAVERYAEQLLPTGDLRTVAQQMEKNLYDLALHSPNGRVRLEASRLLHAICERREEQQHAGRTINVDRLIDELTELTPRGTLGVESADDKTAEAAGAASEPTKAELLR
jgi:hypothetical protein